jgi:cardiolipin synthase
MLNSIIHDKKIFTVPNALSALRILMIPAIVYYINIRYELAFYYLLLSGVTDVLDGLIARKFHMTSDLGIVLDPVADKLTQGCVLLTIASSKPWMGALCMLLIVKESVMVIFGLVVLKKTNRTYSAKWHGKLANGCIYTTLAAHILWKDMPNTYSTGMIILCAAAMLLSLVLYCLQYASILQNMNSTV